MTTRRTFLLGSLAAGTITVLPFGAMAAAHASNTFETDAGTITIHPVSHASFVMETPAGTVYADPVGDPSEYSDFPAPDLVLITHEHGDHYNAETLAAIVGDDTQLIVNQPVFDMLPDDLKAKASPIAQGASTEAAGIPIETIPSYNITEGREMFHPRERGDVGYILTIGGKRIYISGDTEATDEMRALENIDLAFVCMNLPFTMTAEQAAAGVADFKPGVVYPYHYRGRDGGTQDPEEFARLVAENADGVEVKMGNWYEGGLPQ